MTTGSDVNGGSMYSGTGLQACLTALGYANNIRA